MKNWLLGLIILNLLVGLVNMCLIILKLRTAAPELKTVKASLEEEVQERTQANSSFEAEVAVRKRAEEHIDKLLRQNELVLNSIERVPERLQFDSEPAAAIDDVSEETLAAHVDRDRIYEALGEDPRQMLDLYLSDMDRNFEKLAIAIEAGKADEINSIAHNCAGVSATCGITAMVAPLRELERMGRENELAGAAALGIQTRATFGRVKQFLQEEFEGVAVAV